MKLTIDDYAKKFKMSKEMVVSKVKANLLESFVENDVVYIILEEKLERPLEKQKSKVLDLQKKQKTTVATIISLYQKENKHLKEKIVQLETKIDQLISDKEQMLRDERDKIEHLYTTKDEQLKNILELMNAKFQLEQQKNKIHEVKPLETIEHAPQNDSQIIELRTYLKSLDLKQSQRKTIKKRFLSVYDSDIRILQQNGKIYLDLTKYDYSDLLKI